MTRSISTTMRVTHRVDATRHAPRISRRRASSWSWYSRSSTPPTGPSSLAALALTLVSSLFMRFVMFCQPLGKRRQGLQHPPHTSESSGTHRQVCVHLVERGRRRLLSRINTHARGSIHPVSRVAPAKLRASVGSSQTTDASRPSPQPDRGCLARDEGRETRAHLRGGSHRCCCCLRSEAEKAKRKTMAARKCGFEFMCATQM
jgi:hypothetical protein